MGSFYNEGDLRANSVKLSCEVNKNITKSLSFDPSSMKCYLCKKSVGHRELAGLGTRGESHRIVFALADQGFPAAIPAMGGGDCVKILRIEGGHLSELLQLFMTVVTGHWIPPGSLLLVGSLTELVTKGVSGYLSELVELVEGIRKRFGGVLQVVPFVPLPMGGINCAFGVRSLAELAAWLGGIGDYPLPTLTNAIWNFLARGGAGGLQEIYESRHVVPIDLLSQGKKVVHSMGWPFLCNSSIAISEEEEQKLISALIGDLNSGLALALDITPSFDRSPTTSASTAGRGKKVKFVVMGASHARRLGNALRDLGEEVIDLSDGGWKLSRSGITHLIDRCEQLKEERRGGLQLILSVMDSSIFWGETDEGAAPAKKLADNHFHLEGNVVLAGKEIVGERFALAAPLLQAVSGYNTILLSPIPRYLTGGCCREESHCSNWAEEDFALHQLQSLEKTRQQLRDCVFRSKSKAVMIMNPVRLFGGKRDLAETAEALKAVWGRDPVHPEPAVYQRIAEELIVELANVAEKHAMGGGKRAQSPTPAGSASKRTKPNAGPSSWRGGRGRLSPARGSSRGTRTSTDSSGASRFPSGGNYGGGNYGRDYGRGYRGYRGHRGNFWKGY